LQLLHLSRLRLALLCCIGSGFALTTVAQSSLWLQQRTDLWQANRYNPAVFPEENRWWVGLPAFNADLALANQLTYSDFVRTDGDKNLLNFSGALSKDVADYSANYQQRLETVSVGYRLSDQWQLQVGHAIARQTAIQLPRNTLRLFWEGNGAFIGETVEIAPDFANLSYHEFGVGISRKWKQLQLGARVKYLSGIGALKSDPDQNRIGIFTNPDFYQLELTTRYGFYSVGTVTSVDTSRLFYRLETDQLGNSFTGNGQGVGFDLGMVWQLNEQCAVQLSVLDLGASIRWKDARYFNSNAQYNYQGQQLTSGQLINNDDGDLNLQSQLDTLNDIFQFKSTNQDLTTTLPLRVLLGAQYQLNKRWSFGLAAQYMNWSEQDITVLNIGVNTRYQVVKWLDLGVSYNYHTDAPLNVGFSAVAKFKNCQLNLQSDQILSVFDWRNQSRVNAALGLSIGF
jgi:Family of unknown function (DUF5723)